MAALRPLAVPDEGRYGEIGRWMLQSGDWLTPRLNGLPFFHKPPLLYWLQAMSLATFGINEVALRLVPALHAGLMLVALYLSARLIGTEHMARRAVLMLGTSLTFLVGGQYVNHDMLVATWIGVAIWCFAFAFMAGDKPNALLARLGFAACALGMLSKGLIGIALPGMVLVIWLLWTRQFKKVLYLPWFSGLALFALMALPWFVLAQQKYPAFFDYMFIGQQLNRYTATTYNNPQPWWFYLLALVLLFFPWVFFALNQLRREARAPAAAMAEPLPPPLATAWWSLCWIWVVAIIAFFSIPNSKLVGYALPVMPPLALLAALGWERAMAQRVRAGKIFVGLCLLNIGIALVLMLKVADVTRTGRAQDIAQALACAAQPSDTIYVSGKYPYDLPFYAQTRQTHGGAGRLAGAAHSTPGTAGSASCLKGLTLMRRRPRSCSHPRCWRPPVPCRATGLWRKRTTKWPRGWPAGSSFTRERAGCCTSRVVRSAPEGPKAAEHKGLPGCKHQRYKQGQQRGPIQRPQQQHEDDFIAGKARQRGHRKATQACVPRWCLHP